MLVCFLKFYLFEQEQQKQKKNVQNEKSETVFIFDN